jgi:ABC-2 type transport system ATP-binding protein
MEYILRTIGVSKKYHSKMVLNKVNMNIARGDIYGFVGENGSGKTTIIRIITGLISASEGEIELFGIPSHATNIESARKKVGAIVESPSIYRNMTARENLEMQAMILGIKDSKKIEQTLSDVGLLYLIEDKKKAKNFSLGMRQRLGIAMALLGDPEFIILDEPMNGLDPAGIVEVRELMLRLNHERNMTFLISSHSLTELSLVANKYGIISRGTLIKEIYADELNNEIQPTIVIEASDPAALYNVISEDVSPEKLTLNDNGVRIAENVDLNKILNKILSAKIEILSINCNKSNIEGYYLSLMGGKK